MGCSHFRYCCCGCSSRFCSKKEDEKEIIEDIDFERTKSAAEDGIGYLFTAKYGTGKSTHARLWRETFGNRAVMVNDDKPLLRITKEGVIAYGTPWDGKHRLSTNTSVPLKGICILERAAKNHIIRLDSKEQLRGPIFTYGYARYRLA